MPTYDYECDACGHKFELFQGIKDDIQKKCPGCKKMKLRRLFGTGAAVIFKGSGFYQTDYRNENYKKGAAADKTAKEASQPKETSSTDASSTKSSETKSTSSSSESKPEKPKKGQSKD